MVRVLRDPNKKGTGAPRGSAAGVSQVAGPGGRVSKDKASKFSIRRLIARDPAKGVSANIGTKRDIGIFTNDPDIPNVTATPSPKVVTANPKRGYKVPGVKSVADRSTNRSVKRGK